MRRMSQRMTAKPARIRGAELSLLQRFGLSNTSTLVDLGAGTGTVALAAASVGRRVIAVDISPAMLSMLRRRTAELGLGNVECIQPVRP
jgi:predicted RNA methylase